MTARLSSDADANLEIKVPLQYVLLTADSALTSTNRIHSFTVVKLIAVLHLDVKMNFESSQMSQCKVRKLSTTSPFIVLYLVTCI